MEAADKAIHELRTQLEHQGHLLGELHQQFQFQATQTQGQYPNTSLGRSFPITIPKRSNRPHKTLLTVPNLIQRSKLISEGPPARYRLLTVRSNLGRDSVTKWIFGQRDFNIQNKILLMVGETGTGKTTLINAMVNYILGVKFEDEVWFEITEEGGDSHRSDQSKSQTSEITVYEVFAQDIPVCLTMIDTPGHGDTRGRDEDKKIAENLYKLFHSGTGVKEIDAVCLIVKGTENRLSDRQQYVFDAVLSLFGKDIENNIVIFITHSDGLPPDDALNAIKKAGIPYRKDKENEPEHFLVNNRQTVKRNKNYNRSLQTAWEQTEESLNVFFPSLKEENRKSLVQTERVLTESKQLQACISNLQNRIDFLERKRREPIQIQEALKQYQENVKKNENFTFTLNKCYKEKVPIENASWRDRKVTSCSVCEENCHEYGCWFARDARLCDVMKHGYCTVCTGKCHYSKHIKEKKKYITLSKDNIMTFNDLKKQYGGRGKNFESNKKPEEEITRIEKRLNEELDNKQKEKVRLVEEAYATIIKLSEIALKPDSAFMVQSLDLLIPRVEETGNRVLAWRLKELRKLQPESEERVNAAMAYARAGSN